MSTMTLGAAVIRITADNRPFRAALNGVHQDLVSFIPTALMLGARIGDAVIGSAGKAIIAQRAQSALSGSRGKVAGATGEANYWKGELSTARLAVAQAQDDVRNATTAATKAAAMVDLRTAQAAVLLSKQMLAGATTNLTTAKVAAKGAEEAFAGTAARINMMAAAASAAVGVTLALAGALTVLAQAGSVLNAAEHNVDQVFGSSAKAIEDAAQRQADAFGASKSQYLQYASAVGQSLEMLGVDEDRAANQTIRLLDAAQRLAQHKRISFGEAFQTTQAHGALFTEEQVRAYAFEKKVLNNRAELLNAGAEAILRNELAIERINATTEEAVGTGTNWNAQITALMDNLTNLAQMVGADLEPAFVQFLQAINDLIKQAIEDWKLFKNVIVSIWDYLNNTADIPHPERDINAVENGKAPEAASARNKEAIEAARRRQAIGESVSSRGGGGFQGGLVEFARRIQQAGFNPRFVANQEKQLIKAQEQIDAIKDLKKPAGKPDKVAPLTPWF